MDGIQIYVTCLMIFIAVMMCINIGKGKKYAMLHMVLEIAVWYPIVGRIFGWF